MNNIVNNKKRKKKKNTKKPTWDSRIIATRSALDDVPTRPRSKLMKKRVVSLKDLEHLASLAPTASLKELLDVGKMQSIYNKNIKLDVIRRKQIIIIIG